MNSVEVNNDYFSDNNKVNNINNDYFRADNNKNYQNENSFDFEDNNINNENVNNNLIKKKKKLIELVKNLSKLEYIEIFNIFHEDNCIYTGNSNGVFINLTNIQEHTINKIFNFIDFIKNKKKELLEQENIIENIKKDINEFEVKNEKIDYKDESKNYDELSDEDEGINIDNYLCFSSDEDADLDNKLCLKKKKIKYSGKKAKLIKSIRDNNEKNKI